MGTCPGDLYARDPDAMVRLTVTLAYSITG